LDGFDNLAKSPPTEFSCRPAVLGINDEVLALLFQENFGYQAGFQQRIRTTEKSLF
jgi:hypothetical protein